MIHGQIKSVLVAEMSTREHRIVSGLHGDAGGRDEGMDPHELLESALAACTILTVQLYANRKGWNLESTDVDIKIEKEDKLSTLIQRKISFRGELTEEQKSRLAEIATKCPIHRLIEGKVEVKTTTIL